MFLDDELLKICKDEKLKLGTEEELQKLNTTICRKCEEYYQSKLNKDSTSPQIKVALDRTFNLFSSFVRMAKKDTDKTINVLGELFERYPFKDQFLKNGDFKKIYEKL